MRTLSASITSKKKLKKTYTRLFTPSGKHFIGSDYRRVTDGATEHLYTFCSIIRYIIMIKERFYDSLNYRQ